MSIDKLKPFKTYEEQIDILINKHNIKITDKDFAIKALSTMSYYDLINGYKECFAKDDIFNDYITLEYLYTFHHFDHSIQNSLFQYTVYAEKIFKTSVSYILAKNYGVETTQYLKKSNFVSSKNKKSSLSKTLSNIHNVYKQNEGYVDQPTKHYLKTKSHIPPWILFKNVNFADVIELYSFMKGTDKDEICNYMLPHIKGSDRKKLLKVILTIIRKYRNKIAHNLKFITYKTNRKFLNFKHIKNTHYELLIENIQSKDYDNIYSFIISLIIVLNDNYLTYEMVRSMQSVIQRFTSSKDEEELYKKYFDIAEIPLDFFKRLKLFLDL